jgi:RNA polymerase sigma factor for flagellar operon FliA
MREALHILWEEFLRTRTPELKRKLVVHYLDLVRYVVSKFGLHQHGRTQGLEFDDVVHFGVLGLLTALDRFTPAHNVKFETYAVPRIRGAILDELRKLDWVPRSVRETSRKVGKAAHQVMQENGREPLAAEIADKLAMSLEEYRTLIGNGSVTSPRGVAITADPDSAEPLDAAPSDTPTPFEHVRDQETRQLLREAVERLPERDRLVIALYYYEGLKVSEIAKVLDLSEGRISQIHSEVLRQLRNTLVAMEA